jgi:glutathione synthase/RimK-type ligase-like ATP-grasp enzyme
MKKIAFVTYKEFPILTEDDRLAAEFLSSQGMDVRPLIWDATPENSWKEFDLIILRSCWEYHIRTEAFTKWIDWIRQSHLPLCNSSQIVRKNMDKAYLKELSIKGAAIAPTVWLEKTTGSGGPANLNLKELLQKNEWREAVVKPSISMSAHRTWITSPERAVSDEKTVREMLKKSGVMIQKFIPAVQIRGEWSFIFFGKQFSHAVLKRPKAGDFRVQRDFGGVVDFVRPPPKLLAQAKRIIKLIKEPLLYARVDGVESDSGDLILMELELIDPVLFFAADTLSLERFSDAVKKAARQPSVQPLN